MGQGLSLSRASDHTSEWVDDNNRSSDLVAPLLGVPGDEPLNDLTVAPNQKGDEELAQQISNGSAPAQQQDSLQQQLQDPVVRRFTEGNDNTDDDALEEDGGEWR
jgi:hypothetical protein